MKNCATFWCWQLMTLIFQSLFDQLLNWERERKRKRKKGFSKSEVLVRCRHFLIFQNLECNDEKIDTYSSTCSDYLFTNYNLINIPIIGKWNEWFGGQITRSLEKLLWFQKCEWNSCNHSQYLSVYFIRFCELINFFTD